MLFCSEAVPQLSLFITLPYILFIVHIIVFFSIFIVANIQRNHSFFTMADTTNSGGGGGKQPAGVPGKGGGESADKEYSLEQENVALKRKLAAISAQQSGKRAKVAPNDEYLAAINGAIKGMVWRKCKFVTSIQDRDDLVKRVMFFCDFSHLKGKTPEAKDKRLKWVGHYTSECMKALNERRNYLTMRIKDKCDDYMDNNNGQLPDLEVLKSINNRTLDLEKGDNLAITAWWFDKILPTANGIDSLYTKNIRYYQELSDCKTTKLKDKDQYDVECSTKAFALISYENSYLKWKKIWELKRSLKVKHITIKKSPSKTVGKRAKEGYAFAYESEHKELVTKFTSNNVGQNLFGGWDDKGLKLYREYGQLNRQARLNIGPNRKFEGAVLDEMRRKNNIKGKTPEEQAKLDGKSKAAAKKAAGQETLFDALYGGIDSDIDMGEFDDDEDPPAAGATAAAASGGTAAESGGGANGGG